MMQFEEIRAGTRLELEMLNNLGVKIGNTNISQVFDVIKNNIVVVSSPIFDSRPIFVPLNVKMKAIFFHKRYGLQGFMATVIKKEYRENVSVLHLQAETPLEKVQRRKNYRLDCLASAIFRIYPEASSEADEQPRPIKAYVKNISGSGACIITDEDVPKSTLIEITIMLNDTIQVKATCMVLRNTPIEIKKTMSHELGLHFMEISSRDEDNIIKYIFEKQRVMIKKGFT